MGVSNVSFGFKPKARRILNNMMLHHAVETGLDAAIFNPMHVDDVDKYNPKIRELADDLLLNRREDALHRYVEYFETESTSSPKNKTSAAKLGADADKPYKERLHDAVIHRDKRHLTEIIDKLLTDHSASDILNGILLPAMSRVGELMAVGEMILPFVLQSAEVMKEAVAILEPHLKKEGGSSAKGKMVIATVHGDVHDIGKNLVASILRNQGFEVVDLGKQVSIDTIIEAVQKESPDVLGLSALLVTTSQEMAKCVAEFARRGIAVPVIIGGAAVSKDFASRISALGDGSAYAGGVYYAKDAFEASKILDSVSSSKNN
jgi:5-methyltetrahydrofolate--homocysteine methyltransferase